MPTDQPATSPSALSVTAGLTSTIDVLVIGGGPGGSTAANLLARSGHRVLVVERECFPRFHIGESLLPYGTAILRRLGVLDEVAAVSQRKWGAQFLFEPGGTTRSVVFGRGLSRRHDMAFQVRRAELDAILLTAARRAGAIVHEGWEVAELVRDGERVRGAVVRTAAGESQRIEARVVVDASGRDTVVGATLGLRERDPELRQAALFTHVAGAELGLGRDGGDILIVGTPRGWFWLIPLDAETTSVGVVLPGASMRQRAGVSRDAFFAALVAESPELSRRLAPSRQLMPVQAMPDFSYRLKRFAGDGWVTVGDAAAFLDPVFSSGVFLAMHSAQEAAAVIDRALRRHDAITAVDFAGYERALRHGLGRFRRFILSFYEPAFVGIFCSEPPLEFIRRAVVSILAGGVFSASWRLRLGEWLFFQGVERFRRLARKGAITLPVAPPRS